MSAGIIAACVLHALRVYGNLSRAELARFTGLTPQAVANIVDTLMTGGLVREAGRRKSRRGQPPIAIEIAGDGGYAVGVRIDATSFNAVASDLGGELIEMREGPVPAMIETDWLDFVADIHAEFGARFGIDRCLGIGLVTPGPFDIDWPGVPTPGAIPQLQVRGIADQLAARTGTDVLLENDAYAAALGEKLYGQATEFNDFFYVYIGEGVGGGVVIRGEPYRGTRGNAGEFGHLIVDPNGPQCYCGNRGCLGEYLSLGSMRGSSPPAQKPATARRALDVGSRAHRKRFRSASPASKISSIPKPSSSGGLRRRSWTGWPARSVICVRRSVRTSVVSACGSARLANAARPSALRHCRSCGQRPRVFVSSDSTSLLPAWL